MTTLKQALTGTASRYLLVDHALSRMERGLVAQIEVAGPENKDVFDTGDAELNMAGH